MNVEDYLQKYFGYSEFRPLQKEVITSIINRNDTLAVLPTGTGKSVCFQIPGLILGGLTLVITPLIALMKDQVDALKRNDISAEYLASSLTKEEKERIYTLVKTNTISFLYISPERLQQKHFLLLLKNTAVSLVIIDEAHCISEWGDHFRPSYSAIGDFLKQLKNKPVIAAFTATATHTIKEKIIDSLGMVTPKEYISQSIRDNLEIHVYDCPNSFYQNIQLIKILQKYKKQTGIIYCSTRSNVEQLYQTIKEWNIVADDTIAFYHAGLETHKKNVIQEKYNDNTLQLLIATNAFGMGINKNNIRFVIHFNIPSNLEQYYQEIGRAGRDRKHSYCYVLFNPENISINLSFIEKIKNKNQKNIERNNLKKLISFLLHRKCRNNYLENYFLQYKNNNTCKVLCDNCLDTKNIIDVELENTFNRLASFCQRISSLHSVSQSEFLTLQMMTYIALLQPKTRDDYSKIPGIGSAWLDKWFGIIKDWNQSDQLI